MPLFLPSAILNSSPNGQVENFDPDTAKLGVTGADNAIANTGSVVLVNQKESARLTSLTPNVHMALVKRSVILKYLKDLYLFRGLGYYSGNGVNHMTFVSSPNRTAGVDQVLVVGAHGPKETHMLILDWD